jgi:hypothetical protein
MTNRLLHCTFLVAVSCAAQLAWADLNSPTYVRAKQAYTRGDWTGALSALNQYLQEDAAFLAKNADIEKAVEAAVQYCKHQTGPGELIASGAQIVESAPVPAPRLP